jgi:HK97 family phage prohead protease/HK97 family phage major capsid protein
VTEQDSLTFDTPEVAAAFRVDEQSRTITGLAVPYGPVARSGFASWRFQPGSLKWADMGRVKLLRDHDMTQAVGRAVKLDDTDAGLVVSFKVARGDEGDRVLSLAADGVLDGLSVGVDFDAPDAWQPDPQDEAVRLVANATLREVSVTAMPAFDSARVTGVKASRSTDKEKTVPEENTGGTATATAPDLAAFTAALTTFTERLGAPQGRQVIPAGDGVVLSEPPVYTFNGSGPSLVRDTYRGRVEGDQDALDRVRKFQRQVADVQGKFAGGHPAAQFATVTRTVGANVIPPGYRPDLYQPQLFQERPLVAAVSQGQITDATPFTIPVFTSATGATADHVEGTNPTDGSLAIGTNTVTPGAISGAFNLSREVVDAANPAIDQIALQAMRESYSQQTEGKVYTALTSATLGVGGTITAGQVPSGAYVQAVAAAGGGTALLNALRGQMAAYPFRRFASPDRIVLSQEGTTVLAQANDTTGRPLLPSLAPANAQGTLTAGNVVQGFVIDGIAAVPAWSMNLNTAADPDVIMFNHNDVWAWESPTLQFRFEEKLGPAIIQLALFAYFATRILRTSGLVAIRYS